VTDNSVRAHRRRLLATKVQAEQGESGAVLSKLAAIGLGLALLAAAALGFVGGQLAGHSDVTASATKPTHHGALVQAAPSPVQGPSTSTTASNSETTTGPAIPLPETPPSE
jgi:hypothetical protein